LVGNRKKLQEKGKRRGTKKHNYAPELSKTASPLQRIIADTGETKTNPDKKRGGKGKREGHRRSGERDHPKSRSVTLSFGLDHTEEEDWEEGGAEIGTEGGRGRRITTSPGKDYPKRRLSDLRAVDKCKNKKAYGWGWRGGGTREKAGSLASKD